MYKRMFVKHFKSTLGPQDDDEEPHPCVAHMYALHINRSLTYGTLLDVFW